MSYTGAKERTNPNELKAPLAGELRGAKGANSPVSITQGKQAILSGILDVAQMATVSLPYDAVKKEFNVTDFASYRKLIDEKLNFLYKASDVVEGKLVRLKEQEAKKIIRNLGIFEQFAATHSEDEESLLYKSGVRAGVGLLEIRGVIFASIGEFGLSAERKAHFVEVLDYLTLHMLDLFNADSERDPAIQILISGMNKLNSKMDGTWRALSEDEKEYIALLFSRFRADALNGAAEVTQFIRAFDFDETEDVDILLGYAFRDAPWESSGI